MRGKRSKISLVVALGLVGAFALPAAGHAVPARATTIRDAPRIKADGVIGDEGHYARFVVDVWRTRSGDLKGSVVYNGGGAASQLESTEITSFTCSGGDGTIGGTGTVRRRHVAFQVTAHDSGRRQGDYFSISFRDYTKAGEPVAGDVSIHNC